MAGSRERAAMTSLAACTHGAFRLYVARDLERPSRSQEQIMTEQMKEETPDMVSKKLCRTSRKIAACRAPRCGTFARMPRASRCCRSAALW